MSEPKKESGEHAGELIEATLVEDTGKHLVQRSGDDLLAILVQKDASMEMIAKFMDLRDREEDRQAKGAFFEALAMAKSEFPPLRKDKKNPQFDSWYTSLGNLLDTYNPVLGKHGLSLSFPPDTKNEKVMTVECRLTHAMGHSESLTMSAPIDEAAIGKESGKRSRNAIQDMKSTYTYLRSATCEGILGVSGTDASIDNDGNTTGNVQFISEEQIKGLEASIKSTGADKKRFLKHMKLESIKEMPIGWYNRALGVLKSTAIKKAKKSDKDADEPGSDG